MFSHSNRHRRATDATVHAKFREPITLTDEQVAKLLKEAKQSRFGLDLHDSILLAISLGLRLGELSELTFGQIDLSNGEIRLSGRKGIQEVCTVPVTGDSLRMLAGRFAAPCASPYIFGKAPHSIRHKLCAGLRIVREAAGLPGVHWHTFRHNFALRLMNSGASAFQLYRLLRLQLPVSLKHQQRFFTATHFTTK